MDWLGLAERGAVGALLIVLIGAVSDRLRPYYGSVLASIPTTTAVSLFYIAHDHGAGFAAEASTSSLVTQVANVTFVTLFTWLALRAAPRRTWWTVAGGLAAYFAVSATYLWAMHGRVPVLWVNLALYTGVLVFALEARHVLRRMPTHEHAYGRSALKASHIQRAVLGGTLVVVASILAETLGPHWGGLFAAFPATFFSLLLVAYRDRSLPYFVEQALGVIPSTANLVAYIVAVHVAYPRIGVWWGTLVAYAVFAAFAIPLAALNLRSLAKTEEPLSPDAILQAATEKMQ